MLATQQTLRGSSKPNTCHADKLNLVQNCIRRFLLIDEWFLPCAPTPPYRLPGKIRNLEIRLARVTSDEMHCHEPLWSDLMEQRGQGKGWQDSERELSRPEESSDAADTGTQSPSASSSDCHHQPAASAEQSPAPSRASSEVTAGGGGGGGGWGTRFKRFEGQLRQGLEVIGAKAIRSNGRCAVTEPVRTPKLGGGIARAAAAVAEEASVQGKAEGVRRKDGAPSGARGASGDQGGVVDGELEEFWGSDYCTSA